MVRFLQPLLRGATALVCACALSACAANPGPPPVVDEEEAATVTGTPTTTRAATDVPERTTVSIGVDPLVGGLNPHLTANNQELVQQLTDLVLPSAFRNGVMDTDLLDSAEEVEAPRGVAQRVRYKISSAAQWSDGTPISAADFSYLWHGMVTTAGVQDPAGYRAISTIASSDGGRVVTVDFRERVANWQGLFHGLVPSHLFGDVAFDTVLQDDIPASAGRYLVATVDRARGVITLNRNDRYWGTDPARTDVIMLRSVRDAEQAINMLRSGQIGFADFTPEQTTLEALSLLPDVDAETVDTARQLRLHVALPEEARAQLAELIDARQVARLATGRTAPLDVPGQAADAPSSEAADTPDVAELVALGRPVRIGVDPSDTTAATAANILVDQLALHGVSAKVVADRMRTLAAESLPSGKVDAVLSWDTVDENPLRVASSYVCASDPVPAGTTSSAATSAAEPAGATSPDSPEPSATDTSAKDTAAAESTSEETATSLGDLWDEDETPETFPGELSGVCPPDAAVTRAAILRGETKPADAARALAEWQARSHVVIPLLGESRLLALGEGIVGPGTTVDAWRAGLATAPEWTPEDKDPAATSTAVREAARGADQDAGQDNDAEQGTNEEEGQKE